MESKIELPCGLLLLYPVVMVAESVSISRLVCSSDPILNYQTMKLCLTAYLGSGPQETVKDFESKRPP
jgi:hypothetical protein